MRENLTELVFILDKSGSMGRLREDTIGGFNSMIEEQKAQDGEAYVTTVLFSSEREMLHDHIAVSAVKTMTNEDYVPCGLTALLDAIGTTIDSVGARLAKTPENERPGKVIFVIVTDGLENCSNQYSKAKVKEMIEHQQDVYSWKFMFLGANMDAVAEAGCLGIKMDMAKTYTADERGTESVYLCSSKAIADLRGMATLDFCDEALASKVTADALDGIK